MKISLNYCLFYQRKLDWFKMKHFYKVMYQFKNMMEQAEINKL